MEDNINNESIIVSATFTPWTHYNLSEYDLNRYLDKINLALSLMDSKKGIVKAKKMIEVTLQRLENKCKSNIIITK